MYEIGIVYTPHLILGRSRAVPGPGRYHRTVVRTIAVGSGKGGVGKSTVALNLALALTADGARVGLLDADVYGPDVPLMVNLTRKIPATHWTLARAGRQQMIEPVEAHGIKVMSTGFMVAEDQALSWSAQLVDYLLYQFANQILWGEVDYVLVDLPPGTADLQQSLVQRMTLDGVLIVVTPPDVAHLDARKAIEMYRRAGVRILGGVENMAGLACPHCGETIDLLPRVPQERSIWAAAGVEWLGAIPTDPAVAAAGNARTPVVIAQPDSPASKAFRVIAGAVVTALR